MSQHAIFIACRSPVPAAGALLPRPCMPALTCLCLQSADSDHTDIPVPDFTYGCYPEARYKNSSWPAIQVRGVPLEGGGGAAQGLLSLQGARGRCCTAGHAADCPCMLPVPRF